MCHAFYVTATSGIIATAGLAGHMLATDKSLATLPIAMQFIAMTAGTVPASFLMKKLGRRDGFCVGALLGLVGALISMWAIMDGDFVLYCLGSAFVGVFNGFAQYYRFAAADTASEKFKSHAISLVLAGGVVAAVGPLLASASIDLFAPIPFAGVYVGVAGFYVATLVVLRFVVIPKPSIEEREGYRRPLAEIVRQPVFIVALLGALFGYMVMSLLMTATPLAMAACSFGFHDSAQAIQWHVLGMFAPSFITGHLIRWFGTLRVMAMGVTIVGICVAVNLEGITLANFWIGATLLGVGWNFLFIGGTTLLTSTYSPAEKAKTQAVHEFLLFGSVALASLMSGVIHENWGWQTLNYIVIPALVLISAAILWLHLLQRRQAASVSV